MHKTDYRAITEKVIALSVSVAQFIEKESIAFSMSNVQTKNKFDFVSYVDKEAEMLLVKGLSEIIPGSGFIAEEGTGNENGEDYCWIIDPLDGTSNFIHASTPYAISIALSFKNELVAGVIYEITRQESFYAWKDSPAYLNGKEIHVSTVSKVSDALISTGRPHTYVEQYDKLLRGIDFFLQSCHGLRQSGSAATDLAYVACGRYDGRYEFGLKPWDMAAGVLIVRRAGGKVSDFYGADGFLQNGTLIASNALIFEEMKRKISSIFNE